MSVARAVFEEMYRNDTYSQWLGIELLEANEGGCRLKMTVRSDMLNGFGVAHGAITYGLADSAFAFACNSYNRISLSIETSVTHAAAVYPGDILTAEARLVTQSNKIGTFSVLVYNQHAAVVAVFKGICYRTSKEIVDVSSGQGL